MLIKADVGIEAAQVDIGGWDTHSAQDPIAGSMFKTMQDFSNSLAAFYADVIATGYNVTVVAFSEFGRNVRENGSNGTDHGRASALFAMGKGIAGGRVLTKNWPGLAKENLEAGQDLKVTIDYRDILVRDRAEPSGQSESRLRLPDVDADDARRHAVVATSSERDVATERRSARSSLDERRRRSGRCRAAVKTRVAVPVLSTLMSAGELLVRGEKRTLWPWPSEPPAKFQRTVSPAPIVAKVGLKASPIVKMSIGLVRAGAGRCRRRVVRRRRRRAKTAAIKR